MKTTQLIRLSLCMLALLVVQLVPVRAITFSGDTYIAPTDMTFDGMDIVVSNCTLTVDGPHAFASVQVLAGGNITHTFSPTGNLPTPIYTVTGEAHVLSSNSVAMLNFSNVNWATIVVRNLSASVVYTNNVDYQLIPQGNGLTGLQLTPGSAIAQGSTNLVDYHYSAQIVPTGLTLAISNNLLIEAGGSINVDGKGFGGGQGPGHGVSSGSPASGGGGGHGGNGGMGAWLNGGGVTYDSVSQPNAKGSGGGFGYPGLGGTGGGAVKLTIGGALLVDGTLSANGAAGVTNRSGGGSGGSIWISAQTVAGSGSISANGGDGELPAGGGGGGGRIAIQSGINVFTGQTTAFGGNGFGYGGAGTIYTTTGTNSGQVLVDNGGHQGLTTLLPQGSEQLVLTAQAGAVLAIPGSQSLAGLLIRSNASLVVSNSITSNLMVSGNATIEAGGTISADGMGFPANQGRGPGHGSQLTFFVGGGGGYGGNGGNANAVSASGGIGYGNYLAPTDLGSGGASYLSGSIGSAGGGAIHLSVLGTLIVNGTISADGMPGIGDGSGGGSGGSVWISAQMLAGAGIISANGGDGNGSGLYAGGGGGGGRIAIQGINLFFGTASAHGGNGYTRGGAGTIYFGSGQMPAQLVIDNGGVPGTNTLLSFFTSSTADLTISGGAIVAFSGQPYLHSLLVGSNSWVVVSNLTLATSGDLTIAGGGGIIANGTGYGASQGPGAGRNSSIVVGGSVGGGGGYGGFGGSGAGTSSTLSSGGTTYGSVTGPTDRGSGGGAASIASLGSAGGGAIHLTTLGSIQIDGIISANGNNAAATGAGGGSGGSVWLTAGKFSGNGIISANGGNGNGNGGGGGGGRIALTYGTNYFSGMLAARGGSGINRGGAGTIYTKANSNYVGELVIDNGGQAGTNTSWLSTTMVDLTITGGAVVTPPYTQIISNLTIGPGSALVLSNQLQLSVRGDATIQPGGAISADGGGYGPSQGPGAGRSGELAGGVTGGGGGYGGNGASGAGASAAGGSTYGSISAPLERGSGGGGFGTFQTGPGGVGGGAIQMQVSGTLTVQGRISANGNAGLQGGGGGSGGSIFITTGALLGGGLISANGGMGGPQSGGGGGGRISLIIGQANAFDGSITAFGGGGYAWGGAGTVYIRSGNPALYQNPLVILDNGGQLGTNTSWLPTSPFDLTVRGGAVAAPPAQQTVNDLLIETNGWLRLTNQMFTVMNDATVEAGGGIVADGTGFASGVGTGAGRYINVPGYGYVGSGGGYGGYGANAGTAAVLTSGGVTYGSLTTPLERGSGGGAYLPTTASTATGSAGGGAIRLMITGTLDLEGILSAQGLPGSVPGAGGGSGGSIWVTASALTGAGVITVNGGSGNSNAGGGGGGRIALEYSVNNFTGPITAYGGGGANWGGAGTIYLKPRTLPAGQVIVDNGGQSGNRTTVGVLSLPYNLAIRNGALAVLTNSSLLLSNLDLGPGGTLTLPAPLKQMSLTVLRDALIEPGGTILLDGEGYAAMSGPGSGTTTNSVGSGGGYGGHGGASSLQPGGGTYGSAVQPIDPGSSGGFGFGTWTNGSEGGGALRLSVGRALTINGTISANGNPGLQDNAGGGSGGSVWISANVFSGTGAVLANGGDGELFQGGGGGGGRIAIYSPAELFSGTVSAGGGDGFAPGENGTIYYSSSFAPLSVIAQTPNTSVTYAVSSVDLMFNTAIDPYSAISSGVTLTTPNGALNNGQVAVTALGGDGIRLTFPAQTAEGAYTFNLGAAVEGLYGQSLSPAYTGSFAISWPVIQGMVADAQTNPIVGVLLQPDGGLPGARTDAKGAYALKVVPSGNVTITPSLTNMSFVPGAQSYVNVTAPIAGQNYLAITSIAPTATIRSDANGPVMTWQTIAGVTYQAYSSTNMVDWTAYGPAYVGGAGPIDLALPTQGGPQMFFRIRASN